MRAVIRSPSGQLGVVAGPKHRIEEVIDRLVEQGHTVEHIDLEEPPQLTQEAYDEATQPNAVEAFPV